MQECQQLYCLYIIFYILKTVIYVEVGLKCHDMAELQLLGCLNCAFPVFERLLGLLKIYILDS